MSTDTMTEKSVSKRFNSADADVVFCSCDNVLFKIHRKNLDLTAGGFAPPDIPKSDEIVPLSEDSSTLEILFQYVYPIHQPDISSEPFATVSLVAEAAQKYQIFSAVCMCNVVMQIMIPAHAFEVFQYATKHELLNIVDKTAPSVVELPLETVVQVLPAHLILPWIRYHTAWMEVLFRAIAFPKNEMGSDSSFFPFSTKFNEIKAVKNVHETLKFEGLGGTDMLRTCLPRWKRAIEADIQQFIKPFSYYINNRSPKKYRR